MILIHFFFYFQILGFAIAYRFRNMAYENNMAYN